MYRGCIHGYVQGRDIWIGRGGIYTGDGYIWICTV